MKFTPGPWHWRSVEGGWDGVEAEGGEVVCKLVANVPVNAQLIAAAPDLYAACEAAYAVLGAIAGATGQPRVALDKVVAALERAGGAA